MVMAERERERNGGTNREMGGMTESGTEEDSERSEGSEEGSERRLNNSSCDPNSTGVYI